VVAAASVVRVVRSRGARSTGILATPDDKASIMIVISVHDERDGDFFIVIFAFGLSEGEADGAGVEEDYA
jgi:hypothetical protein